MCVDNVKRKIYHNGENVERCTKPNGEVRKLKTREIKDVSIRKECMMSVKSRSD